MIDVNTREYRKATLALGIGAFLIFCNLYLFQPLLPVMAESFDVSVTRVNWLMAGSSLTLSALLIPWAICSEINGRYGVLIISLFLLPVTGLLVLLTESLLAMTLSRVAMGAALAGFAAVAVAYMSDEFSPKALSMAVGGYISANSFGGITGRIFGGVISEYWSWQTAVVAMALISFTGALAVYWMLPKPRRFKPDTQISLKSQLQQTLLHIQNPRLWVAMLIGGINFALFVNLFTVMGLRLVAPPYTMPVSVASMIFLCYLGGSISARMSGHWCKHHATNTGLFLGASISLLGTLVASYESIVAMIVGLVLVSSGSFFLHSLAYGWVSQKATTAKATANALYLVHYYAGGGLGGFFLIACWEVWGWQGVLFGSFALYLCLFLLALRLRVYERRFEPVAELAER